MMLPRPSRTTTRTCTRFTRTLKVVGVSLVVTSSLGRCSSGAGGIAGGVAGDDAGGVEGEVAGAVAGAGDADGSGTGCWAGGLGAGDCADDATQPTANTRNSN